MIKKDIKSIREYLKVYLIMGSTNCMKDPEEILAEAIEGGVTLFQYREKGIGSLSKKSKVMLAERLQAICRENDIPFLVNDDIELALKINADGIHIGQDDDSAEAARARIGKDKLLGVSVHSLEEAEKAIHDGADYLGIGPIYETATKKDAKAARGTELIKAIRKKGISLPIVGIGGIRPGNAGKIIEDGGDGVSVITGITHAVSAKKAAEELRNEVNSVNNL
ncbi:thiamine phosphate synthase [Bacillus sp. MUM 13]|uniref:thiamine phosphate synthase n=1 Tax=Bacillus sp. MUM 13 TaxID=1678001 RepID=UPI0008F5ADF3|nr:thiamine phosphate synthase [Bacillus sp. MUM 13]OIK14938.1 thiamine-phosphate diphosphorylase [Bacillus sp. MUM 13]